MLRNSSSLVTLFLVFILIGCASGGNQPVTPQASDTEPEAAADSTHQLWGYWQCELDPATGEINMVPARTSQLHLNIAKPVDMAMGMSIKVLTDESDPANGLFVVRMGITHPFPGFPQFSAFDVRAILITTAEHSSGGFNLPGDNDPKVLNADGYTRYWNPVEFPVPGLLGYSPGIHGMDPPEDNPLDSTINPYKQFASALTDYYKVSYLTMVPPTSILGRGVLHDDDTNYRKWEIVFPIIDEKLKIYFNYAIDVSWDMPSDVPPDVPNDFPLEANSDEAFIVDAEVTSNTLWTIDGAPMGGGELGLEIEIWDWQGWLDDYDGQIGPLVVVSPYCEFEEGVMPSINEPGMGKAILTATLTGQPSATGAIPVYIGVSAPGTSYKQGAIEAPDVMVAAFNMIYVDVAVPDCEDNTSDDCTSAWDIGPEESVDGLLCLFVDETDWYKFHVNMTGSASGTISLTAYETCDMNLILYMGCPPVQIDYSSNSGNVDEQITISGLTVGEYYIEVALETDNIFTPLPYNLTTSITGIGEDCTYDDNNTDETADAVGLNSNVDESVCLDGDELDWFTFEISPDSIGYGTIDLDNQGYANNDIALFDSTLMTPLFSGNEPGTADEHFDIPSLEAGEYFILIEAQESSPIGDRDFTLVMGLEEIVVSCDDQDGNNTYLTAELIELVDNKTGTVCFPTDPDWYTFTVPDEGSDGSISLDNFDANDNDLYLYGNPAEPPIGSSELVGNMAELIVVPALVGGIYYIKVTASSDAPSQDQEYELTTDLTFEAVDMTEFYVHAHIVRSSTGTDPATTPDKVQQDIDWANEFYGIYFGGSVTLSAVTYINNTAWLSATVEETYEMWQQYNTLDGSVNVFYVDDFPDMAGAAAYAMIECEYETEDYSSSYSAMSDWGEDATLAHELGHIVGLLADMYWIDYGYNCNQISYCNTGPSGIYCDEDDADIGNLMYWPVGTEVSDYWVSVDDIIMNTSPINSQAENMMFFNTWYPDAFYMP